MAVGHATVCRCGTPEAPGCAGPSPVSHSDVDSFAKMRKKNAGALFMDFHVSPDDRVGGQPQKKRAAAAPRRKAAAEGPHRARLQRRARLPRRRARARRGKPAKEPKRQKVKKVRGKRERKPLTLGRMLLKLVYWLFLLGLWGGIAVAGVVAYFDVQLPSSNTWAVPDRPANIRILAADGQLISNRGKTGGEAVSMRELPHYVPAAFIAIEDRRFYEHFGVDVMGLMSVALESVQAGEITRGASTITQQLAKNLFLTPDQTLARKVQEMLLAVWLEQNYTKDDILELYLNRMFFGTDAQGRELSASRPRRRPISASRRATCRSAKPRSSPARSRRPRASTRAPATRSRSRSARPSCSRRWPARATSPTDEARAAEIDPNQQIRTKVAGAEYYVADWVETLMQAYIGDVSRGRRRLDHHQLGPAEGGRVHRPRSGGQRRARSAASARARWSRWMSMAPCARWSAASTTRQSQYNRAVTGRRQPGSAFKPFVYLAAMEKGYTPDTVADDAPFDYNGWSPAERLGQVRRPGDPARCARLFAQHRLRPPRHRRRPADGGRRRDAHGHLLAHGRRALDRARHLGSFAARADRRLCALRQWRLRRHRQRHHPHRDRRRRGALRGHPVRSGPGHRSPRSSAK